MSDQLPADALMREVSDLEERIVQLRQTATMRGTDLRAALDAALVELELSLTALRSAGGEHANETTRSAAADLDRRVLRTIFQDAPVPIFLLARDGTIRRVNRQAAALVGTSPGYAAGKPLASLCELPSRAPLTSQLAGVVRTGRRRRIRVRFLGRTKSVETVLILVRAWVRGEPEPLLLAAAAGSAPASGDEEPAEQSDVRQDTRPGDTTDDAVAALVHRLDLLTTATEQLLEDRTFNESVAVRRCARLLAAELADWVIVDICDEAGGLRRHVVMGPEDERSVEAARTVEKLAPEPDTLVAHVGASRQSALISHLDDLDALGTTSANVPVCALLNATSVLSVPLREDSRVLGVVTLTASSDHVPFDLMDLGLVERLARILVLILRADRVFRRRSEVAEALQESLLPRQLPRIDGIDVAARYLAVTRGVDVGGDFYDVFETPAGFGLVLGDVCGKGEEAAAVTATARHGIRLLSRWNPKPTEVMRMVNEALLADHDRFVTAIIASVEWRNHGLRATIGSAGHQPAIIIRRDGVIRTATGGGVPLGLFDDFEAGMEIIELEPGDTLFVHSDGVVDACDAQRRSYGHDQLVETLARLAGSPASELVAGIERILMDFCDGDLRDDVSMLALRVLDIPHGVLDSQN